MDFGLLLTNRPSLVYNCITVEHNRFMFTIHGKMIKLNTHNICLVKSIMLTVVVVVDRDGIMGLIIKEFIKACIAIDIQHHHWLSSHRAVFGLCKQQHSWQVRWHRSSGPCGVTLSDTTLHPSSNGAIQRVRCRHMARLTHSRRDHIKSTLAHTNSSPRLVGAVANTLNFRL